MHKKISASLVSSLLSSVSSKQDSIISNDEAKELLSISSFLKLDADRLLQSNCSEYVMEQLEIQKQEDKVELRLDTDEEEDELDIPITQAERLADIENKQHRYVDELQYEGL